LLLYDRTALVVNVAGISFLPQKCLQGAVMTNLERLNELECAWLDAKRTWEEAHHNMDVMIRRHFEGNGPAPSCRMLEAVDDLLYVMCEARGELDYFIREHADSSTCTERVDNLVDKDSNSFGGAIEVPPPV
jgi:hypothetical protein